MSIDVLIAEDELHSRERLKELLRRVPQVRLAGEAGDGLEAVETIERLRPGLVLLDIEMPGCNGFEVLRRLSYRPLVIFITAYDQYAVQAFAANAVDYLLKPTTAERLQQAVDRALQRGGGLDPALLESLQRLVRRQQYARTFSVKVGDEILLIPESEVFYFKAEDKYVFLCTAAKSYFYYASLRELEEQLDPDLFLRIHKSFIVAVNKVRKIKRWFLGDYLVEMADPAATTLKVGRSYLAPLKEKLRF